jgi:hypothetical protein
MDDRVLAWKGKTLWSNGGAEDLAMEVKLVNGGVDGVQSVLVDDRTPNEIAKLGDVCYSLYHVWGDMVGNGGKTNLSMR